jgi:hypothetical protein
MSSFDDTHITRIEAQKHWERARQAVVFERITGLLPSRTTDLLSFEEVRDRLRLVQKTYRGLHEIPLENIIGSVGRYRDFTRTFLPRNPDLQERWQRVNTVAATQGVPPIDLYQVGESYFVLDGNHRVSVAKANGAKTIEAHVWEFPTPVGLSAQANLDEVLVKAEYAQFLEWSKLDKLRPEAQMIFTAPGRYSEVEVQIEMYRHALEMIDEEPVSLEDAVTAWYDMIYTPAVQIIQEQGILDLFPNRTEADLFIWTWRYNHELSEKEEGPVLLAQTAGALAEKARIGPLGRLWQKITSWLKDNKKEGVG